MIIQIKLIKHALIRHLIEKYVTNLHKGHWWWAKDDWQRRFMWLWFLSQAVPTMTAHRQSQLTTRIPSWKAIHLCYCLGRPGTFRCVSECFEGIRPVSLSSFGLSHWGRSGRLYWIWPRQHPEEKEERIYGTFWQHDSWTVSANRRVDRRQVGYAAGRTGQDYLNTHGTLLCDDNRESICHTHAINTGTDCGGETQFSFLGRLTLKNRGTWITPGLFFLYFVRLRNDHIYYSFF